MIFGKKIKEDTDKLISAMYQCGFDNLFKDISTICYMVKLAKSHHKLQEIACNQGLSIKQEKRELTIEKQITTIAKSLGLMVEFQGDPRGYTVKLHSSKKDLYNTWGGPEAGYGI